MCNTSQKKKENFKAELRERLKWYTFEAPEEELDITEIEEVVRLLEHLEKDDKKAGSTAEEAYGQFEAYKAAWEEDEEKLKDLPDDGAEDNLPEVKAVKSGKRFFARKHRMAASIAAAAILAVVFTTGGAVGVYAEQNGGFFQFLQEYGNKVEFITSPEVLEAKEVESNVVAYHSVEEVPEVYREDVVKKEDLKLLEGFELQSVEILETTNLVRIFSCFYDVSKGKLLNIGCKKYKTETVLNNLSYGNYILVHSIVEEEIQLEVLSTQETEQQEYVVIFYFENTQYYVQGEGEQEYVEELAREYVRLLTK